MCAFPYKAGLISYSRSQGKVELEFEDCTDIHAKNGKGLNIKNNGIAEFQKISCLYWRGTGLYVFAAIQ